MAWVSRPLSPHYAELWLVEVRCLLPSASGTYLTGDRLDNLNTIVVWGWMEQIVKLLVYLLCLSGQPSKERVGAATRLQRIGTTWTVVTLPAWWWPGLSQGAARGQRGVSEMSRVNRSGAGATVVVRNEEYTALAEVKDKLPPPGSLPTWQPDDGSYFKEFPKMAFHIYHGLPREAGGKAL